MTRAEARMVWWTVGVPVLFALIVTIGLVWLAVAPTPSAPAGPPPSPLATFSTLPPP